MPRTSVWSWDRCRRMAGRTSIPSRKWACWSAGSLNSPRCCRACPQHRQGRASEQPHECWCADRPRRAACAHHVHQEVAGGHSVECCSREDTMRLRVCCQRRVAAVVWRHGQCLHVLGTSGAQSCNGSAGGIASRACWCAPRGGRGPWRPMRRASEFGEACRRAGGCLVAGGIGGGACCVRPSVGRGLWCGTMPEPMRAGLLVCGLGPL